MSFIYTHTLPNLTLGVSVSLGALLAGLWMWRKYLSSPVNLIWEEVGEVSELLIYPLKSARAIRRNEAQATIYGLASGSLEDRAFTVITEEGNFITSRQAGILASVVTEMEDSILILRAKGYDPLRIDVERDLTSRPVLEARMRGTPLLGVDCGQEAADWLTNVLYRGEKRVRLIHKGDVLRDRRALSPKYFNFKNYRKKDRLYYADEGSFMVGSQSSLDDLNGRLEKPVVIENFRPNIVVRGSKPYDEDDWIYVRIGEVILRRLKPCERCILVTVDPKTGERHPDKEPITTLKKYRLLNGPPELAKRWASSPIFGVTMSIDQTGKIAVGDLVKIARGSLHPKLKGF